MHIFMACQLLLNVFYSFDMKDKKFTNNYKTIAQRVQSAFIKVLWVAGGGKGGVRMSSRHTSTSVGVKIPQLGVNNLRLNSSRRSSQERRRSPFPA